MTLTTVEREGLLAEETEGAVLVHYSEIGVKGNNRHWFIDLLMRNMRDALTGLPIRVQPLYGRLLVRVRPRRSDAGDLDDLMREVCARLRFVPGIANFSVACAIPTGRDFPEPVEKGPFWAALVDAASDLVRRATAPSGGTFVVRARRAEKQFPMTSLDIERQLGAELLDRAAERGESLRVRLEGADVTCRVELLRPTSFVYGMREQGPGGLPVGSSGVLVSLLSSGFDSPVASWQMLRRGARMVFVHFHGYPLTDRSSAEHVRDLVALLSRSQPESRLYLVPFGFAQQEIITACPRDLRMVAYRRLMMRIACAVAEREKALGVVTGESLGQVASQTLQNLAVIDEAASLPVYRPLIGTNKEEIVEMARRLGTYDISADPTPDCCSLMVAKHPVTRGEMAMVAPIEAQVEMERLIRESVERAEIVEVRAERKG